MCFTVHKISPESGILDCDDVRTQAHERRNILHLAWVPPTMCFPQSELLQLAKGTFRIEG